MKKIKKIYLIFSCFIILLGAIGIAIIIRNQFEKANTSEMLFWYYTGQGEDPVIYTVKPGRLPEKLIRPLFIQQGKFGADMYLYNGKLYWSVMEGNEYLTEEDHSYMQLLCYDLESKKEQVVIDSREQMWNGSIFLPITTDGSELFVGSKENSVLDGPGHYPYLKCAPNNGGLSETELYGCWYVDRNSYFYDRDKILLQKQGQYYYLSSVISDDKSTGNESIEESVACYDMKTRCEYQYSVSDILEKIEDGKYQKDTNKQEMINVRQHKLFLRENCFYLDYQDENGAWHGYRLIFEGSHYELEQDETHSGGNWERVAVLKEKQIFMQTEDKNAPYFFEYDWKTEKMEQISIPALHPDSVGIPNWVVQEQKEGYILYRMEGPGIAMEGFHDRNRCLVRWYQGEGNWTWYERMVDEEEEYRTIPDSQFTYGIHKGDSIAENINVLIHDGTDWLLPRYY